MTKKPVSIDDLLAYRFIANIQMAPEGDLVAFLVNTARPDYEGYDANIYLAHLEEGWTKQLTCSGKITRFVWANSNDLIFLTGAEGGGSIVFRLPVCSGEAIEIARLPRRVESMTLWHDKILYTASEFLGYQEEGIKADCRVLHEIPYWKNGKKGFTDRCRNHLFLFDLDHRQEEKLVQGYFNVVDFSVNQDQIAYIGQVYRQKAPVTHQLWLHNLSSGKKTCLSEDEFLLERVHFLNDERIAVLGTDMVRYNIRQSREVMTVDIKTNRWQSLTPGWDRMVGNHVNTDCRLAGGPPTRVRDEKIYIVITEKDSAYLDVVNQEGNIKRLISARGSVDAFDVKDEWIVYAALGEKQLQELFIRKGDRLVQLTELNKKVLAGREVSVPEHFNYQAGDGTLLDGWLMKPFGFDAMKKYPAILMIHGGPKTVYGSVFYHEMQVLAGLGYVLYFCNPRGSAGRGDAFADIHATYGEVDYNDVMTLARYVADKPFIDKNRLGVMGGSYGGFLTNWIIGHTDFFQTACSQRSIANWISKFCSTDTGYFINRDRGTPWDSDRGEKLWWHSPLRYADKVKTPTLFIHAEEDYNCLYFESLQMFNALCYHGVETKLVLFSGENHNLSRTGKPKNRIRRLQEIAAWFDRFLK